MELAVAGTRRDAGVTIVVFGLKLVWDVAGGLKVGERGVGYVLDNQGRVVAHSSVISGISGRNAQARVVYFPDVSPFQRDFSSLPQVEAARDIDTSAGRARALSGMSGKDVNGHDVLVAYYPIPALGWLAFAEIPVEDADALAR